jgi:hypothetical protein
MARCHMMQAIELDNDDTNRLYSSLQLLAEVK